MRTGGLRAGGLGGRLLSRLSRLSRLSGRRDRRRRRTRYGTGRGQGRGTRRARLSRTHARIAARRICRRYSGRPHAGRRRHRSGLLPAVRPETGRRADGARHRRRWRWRRWRRCGGARRTEIPVCAGRRPHTSRRRTGPGAVSAAGRSRRRSVPIVVAAVAAVAAVPAAGRSAGGKSAGPAGHSSSAGSTGPRARAGGLRGRHDAVIRRERAGGRVGLGGSAVVPEELIDHFLPGAAIGDVVEDSQQVLDTEPVISLRGQRGGERLCERGTVLLQRAELGGTGVDASEDRLPWP